MGCYKTAEANAKQWLREKGAIDKYLNIIDVAQFKRLNHDLTIFAKNKYKIDGKWFYEENNKVVPNKQLFRRVDKINGVGPKDLYYQLFENKNSPVNQRINRLLERVGREIGINVTTIEKYKKSYKDRIGEDVDPIAIADLEYKIIAYDKGRIDRLTLPEEFAHFIVEDQWDTDLMRVIRGTDADGNTINNYLRSSRYWTENYQAYNEKYEGDQAKIEKEIVGKILADRIAEQAKLVLREQLPPLVRRLYELLETLMKRFFRKINKDYKLQTLAQEVEDAAGIIARNFVTSGTTLGDLTGVKTTTPTTTKEAEIALADFASSIRKRRSELVNTFVGLVTPELKKEYADLVNTYGKDTIDNLINRLNELRQEGDPKELEDIARLIELEKGIIKDKEAKRKFKLYNEQLKEINKAIREHNFLAGVELFVFAEDGMLETLQRAKDVFDNLEEPEEGDTRSITEIIEQFKPHVDALRILSRDYNVFEEEFRKKLSDALDRAELIIGELDRRASDIADANFTRLGKEMNQKDAEWSLNANDYHDINLFQRLWGSTTNISNPLAQRWMSLIYKHKAASAEKSTKFAVDLVNKLEPLLKKANKFGYRTVFEAMVEREDGKPTGFFLNRFRLGGKRGFLQASEDASIKIIEDTIQFAHSQGMTVPTHADPAIQNELIHGWLNTRNEFEDQDTKDVVRRYFREQWAWWKLHNTTPRPDVLAYIEKRRSEMNEINFQRWYNSVVHTVHVETATSKYSYTYYSGELALPTDGKKKIVNWKGRRLEIQTVDWVNPDYENRLKDANFKSALHLLRNSVMDAKYELGLATSLEETVRLPQITKGFLDAIYSKTVLKDIGHIIGDAILKRADDETRAQRFRDGSILRSPAIRFVTPVDNPAQLSLDLQKTVVAFVTMKNQHVERARILPELLDILATANRVTFRQGMFGSALNKAKKVLGKEVKKGTSQFEDKLELFLQRHIYGEEYYDLSGIVSAGKIIRGLAKYVVNTVLLGNYVAALTGFTMASIQNVIEAVMGEFLTGADYAKAKVEYFKEFFGIVADYKAGVKSNKVTAAMQETALIDSIVEAFSNLDKSRVVRAAYALPNYGFWRAVDHMPKAQGMIAVANNIRLVDGNWELGRNHRRDLTSDPRWKKGKTLWDSMSYENGKIKYDQDVTPEAILLWKTRTSTLAQRLDQKPDEVETGTIRGALFGPFLTQMMGWLFQGIEMRTKKKVYHEHLDLMEEGYFRSLSRFVMENMRENLLAALLELTLGTRAYKMISGEEQGYMDYTQVQGRKRILIEMITMTTVFILAMAAIAAAADDDDDNYFLSMLMTIAIRLVMERGAFLSLSELMNYIDKPVAGIENVEGITNTFGLIGETYSLLAGQDNDDVGKSGLYKGFTKRQKKIVKSMPLFRGMYENLGAGYINEILYKQGIIHRPTTTVGTGIKRKGYYLRDNVINKGSIGDLHNSPYLGSTAKLLGAGIVETFSDIKNDELGELPTLQSLRGR